MQDALAGGSSLLASLNSELPALLGPVSELRDPVNNSKYSSAALSRDGEYLLAAAASKTHHVLRVWDSRSSAVAVVLEGPAVGLQSAVWHPDPARCAASKLTQLCFLRAVCGTMHALHVAQLVTAGCIHSCQHSCDLALAL